MRPGIGDRVGRPRPAENRGSRQGHDESLKRDRFDVAMQHCVDLGLEVKWADLGDKRRGRCHALNGHILLSRRLTMAQAASTLAHEIGHCEFGDTHTSSAIERRAWEYGASLLIRPSEYAWAEDVVGHNPAALALELEVTPRLVESWCSWWRRQGRAQFAEQN